MLYISIRFVAALVSIALLVIGGTITSSSDSVQSQSGVTRRSAAEITPSPSTIVLHGEIPNTNRDQQRLTLGAGERLEWALEKTVRQMDTTLTHSQTTTVVQGLIATIQAEKPDIDVNNLRPGVSMVVQRLPADSGKTTWDVYLGKYSGIANEEG